ncbi:hypothetical protein HDV57DRAFT_494873 [Trichoderma longibrachiatum]
MSRLPESGNALFFLTLFFITCSVSLLLPSFLAYSWDRAGYGWVYGEHRVCKIHGPWGASQGFARRTLSGP